MERLDYHTALVVCRHANMRDCLGRALWSIGFGVDMCEAEMDAFRLCQRREHDLVAISNEMPVMSAETLIWMMKIFNPKAKYVVIAEARDRQAEQHAALLGVTEWWFPPFEQETVARAISELGLVNPIEKTLHSMAFQGRRAL